MRKFSAKVGFNTFCQCAKQQPPAELEAYKYPDGEKGKKELPRNRTHFYNSTEGWGKVARNILTSS